jgi:cyclase
MRTVITKFSLQRCADRQRLPLLSCIGACVLFASLTHAQTTYDFSKVEIKPTKLADNFYVIDESEVHGGSISILTGPEGVAIVDTGVAPLAAKVEAAIKKLSSQPIRYVLNTHAHVDEVAGNEYFGRLGATIVAREQVRDTMLHPKAPAVSAALEGRQARQVRPPAPDIAAPKLTYANDMTVHFDGQDIQLVAVPRAHTDGDALIYFPGVDIIVAGDVLRAYEFPSIGRPDGGTLPGMLDALARLIGLAGPATRIITSHGSVVDRSVAVAQRDLLLTTRDRVTALIDQGKTLDEVIAAKVTADLGAHALPGHIGADAFVRDVYEEIKVGR